MKKIILLLIVSMFHFCTAQKIIKSLDDKNLIENIVTQFSEKAKIKNENSVFALYFKENPEITEVQGGIENKQIYDGFTATIYRFEHQDQVNAFAKDFDVYSTSKNIFYIFDRSSNSEFLKRLKKNKLSVLDINYNSTTGYDPKSWVLNFDSENLLKECYPYDCN
ncbi:hypothetical protein ODZ84_01870 [Chryseobacterium fluminis]|uniref:hypothetical protein n=1 Tax=Chryseobacterium fluminis TaxID=2983606 RepID=UPI00224F5E8D|nr:hypothetical protein [Chryseobacterium sp. MMS21-Ot14]UZT98340.1 hypothetical protein ODZ84_01870 [Chryseobacterium sp. MMS21-Ot14]